jgi:ribosomal protein S18 acetylase RimI-like enzyme
MTANWQIRRLWPEDAAAVLAADVFDGPATPEGTARFLGAVGSGDPRNILMVAEQAGAIVGFASGTVLDHPDKAPNLYVQEVGVNDEAQRQGIGRALVEALRDEGRKLGCTSAWVMTEADNIPARALYADGGGVEVQGVVMVEWYDKSS